MVFIKRLFYIALIILSLLNVCTFEFNKNTFEVTFDLESSASNDELTHTNDIFITNNYASYYFYNLTRNFGRNDKGSCTYVAFAQLLSFWDSCWDDSIIDENFDAISLLSSDEISLDVLSPGIRFEEFNGRTMSSQDYYNQIEQNWGGYFHLFLIKKGKELFGQYNFDDDNSPCGLTYDQLMELANYYMYDYKKYSTSEYEIHSTKSNIRNFIIENINNGYPVEIRMGRSRRSGGHAMVAYDYDQEKNVIYVHPGWDEYPSHVSLTELGYDVFWDATCIIPKKKHTCSNDYLFTKGYYSNSHCACELDKRPNSEHSYHSYDDRYENIGSNNSKHRAYCKCGEFIEQNHSYNGVWVSGGKVMGVCTKCQTTCIIRNLSLSEIQLYNMNLLNFNLLVI